MLLGRKGRNQQIPELSSTVPYDAFKVDVYALGDVYVKEFVEVCMLGSPPRRSLLTPPVPSSQKFSGFDKLQPLVDVMKRTDPSERVSAQDALVKFRDIRAKDFNGYLRWRLRPRDESIPETVVYSAHHLYKTVASAFGSNRPAS